jgi:hypothetical protein
VKNSIVKLSICAALLTPISPAGAGSLLPPATILGYIGDGVVSPAQTSVNSIGTTSHSSALAGNSETTSVTISNSPAPSISATSTATGTFDPSTHTGTSTVIDTSATYTYYFEIQGPSPTALVLVNASGGINGGLLPTGSGANLIADLAISSPTSPYNLHQNVHTQASGATYIVPVGSGYGYASTASENFNVNSPYTLSTGAIYSVVMSVYLESTLNNGTTTLSAFVDPTFTINTPGYSIDYSLAPTPATTPLPSTWLMLLSGLAALGFMAHRGSKNDSSAFAAA